MAGLSKVTWAPAVLLQQSVVLNAVRVIKGPVMVLDVVAVWLTATVTPSPIGPGILARNTILVYSLEAEAVTNGSGLLFMALMRPSRTDAKVSAAVMA